MSKIKLTLGGFMFLLLLLFGLSRVDSRNPDTKNTHNGYAPSGTLQKMIVENASITMQLDLNGLSGSSSLVARPVTLHFAAAPNSFFPVLVFNDLLRGLQPGSMASRVRARLRHWPRSSPHRRMDSRQPITVNPASRRVSRRFARTRKTPTRTVLPISTRA